MKLFLKNIVLFLLIPLIPMFVLEIVLPSTWFTFRTWEAVTSRYVPLIGPFYPSIHGHMIEVGDLAHHTQFSVKKNVIWLTDRLGFRNKKYILSPDILIIGDSNIAGSSLSQEEMLSSRLNEYTPYSTYNVAPADINTCIQLIESGLIQLPRIVIFSRIERRLLDLPNIRVTSKLKYLSLKLNPYVQFIAINLDKLIRANSLRSFHSTLLRYTEKSKSFQSNIDKRIFFHQGLKAVIHVSKSKIKKTTKRLQTYKKYFNSRGSKFIFLPIPNKETILWEYVKLSKQPLYLDQLIKQLIENNILTVNTFKLFNELLEKNIFPYHLDDTHWNKYAVEVAARRLSKLIASIE